MRKKKYKAPEAEGEQKPTVDLNVQAQKEITIYTGLSLLRKGHIFMVRFWGRDRGIF